MNRESYRAKIHRLAAELATLGYTIHPVEPKGALYGPRCTKCHGRIVVGTGSLILDKWCGRCAGIEQEAHEAIDSAA